MTLTIEEELVAPGRECRWPGCTENNGFVENRKSMMARTPKGLDGLANLCRKHNSERESARIKRNSARSPEQIAAIQANHPTKTKLCPWCGEEKPFSAYRSNTSTWLGLHNMCRECEADYKRLHTLRKARMASLGIDCCVYCGSTDSLTTEHLILGAEGFLVPENLVHACKSCNSRKHSQSVPEFLSWLKDAAHPHPMLGLLVAAAEAALS